MSLQIFEFHCLSVGQNRMQFSCQFCLEIGQVPDQNDLS